MAGVPVLSNCRRMDAGDGLIGDAWLPCQAMFLHA